MFAQYIYYLMFLAELVLMVADFALDTVIRSQLCNTIRFELMYLH